MKMTDGRPWFQIHLSTTLFASFVAGTLFYLNYAAISSVTMWDHGLPFPDYPAERSPSGMIGMRGGPISIGMNLAFNLGAVFVLTSIFEFFTRCRFKLHAITWAVAIIVLLVQCRQFFEVISSLDWTRGTPEADMPPALFVGALMFHLSAAFIITFICEYIIRERAARRQPRSSEVGSSSRRDDGQ